MSRRGSIQRNYMPQNAEIPRSNDVATTINTAAANSTLK